MMVPNVDQFMLSRYSQDSVAAVGNDNVVFNLVILTLAVLSQAATILIAHHRGAGNMGKVNEVCTVALFTNLVLGAVISLFLFFFDDFFLQALGIPHEIWGDASLYIRWIGLFVFIQSMYMAFISFLRGFALLKLTMICSLVMNITNIAGNMALIHGLGPILPLGWRGSAFPPIFPNSLASSLSFICFTGIRRYGFPCTTSGPFPGIRCTRSSIWASLPAERLFLTSCPRR